jgi:hypothetical protein
MVIIIMEIIKIFSNKNNFNLNFSIDVVLVYFQYTLHIWNCVTVIQSKKSHKSYAVR